MSRLLLSIILLACCLPIVAHGKTWRGIVPLRSTRADVERLLGPGNRGHYQFDEERAHVNYAEKECNPVNGCLCLVPKDTVISIHVQLEVEMSFSKLNIDKKNYEKFVSRKDPNLVTYSNDKEGIIYTVNEENDDVKAINYLPTAKDCQAVIKRAKRAGVKGPCRKAFASVNPDTQGWGGIVPLRSDCNDVKQKLGITECRSGAYDVSDARLSLVFSEGHCASGWNVPAGVVISVDVRPKVRQRFSDLKLDLKLYRRIVDSKGSKLARYEKNDQSVRITVNPEGFVTDYSYGPSTKDEALRCRAEPGAHHTGSFKFDEYGDISEDEEKAKLDNLAFQLRASDWLGYIIVYHGPSTSPKMAYARGERAKAYLMQTGVDGKRVFVVDGGRREELTIELFATIPGAIPPSPRPDIP